MENSSGRLLSTLMALPVPLALMHTHGDVYAHPLAQHQMIFVIALLWVAKRLCTEHVNPDGVAPLLASRLIAIDKCPGVRPIGVDETSRRIIGKAVLTEDILDATGKANSVLARMVAAKQLYML